MRRTPETTALARERFAVRDYHGTVLVLTQAEQAGPLFADALNLLGLALAMIGRGEDAVAAFDRALAVNPRYVEALLNRAVTLLGLGEPGRAAESFRLAEEYGQVDASGFPSVVANQLANSHADLGDAYRAAGDGEAALAQYRRALELRPGFVDIRFRLGRALLETGAHAEAAVALEQVCAARPEWLDGRLHHGLALYLGGQLAEAAAAWDAAARIHPEEPRLEVYRSMLARRRAGTA